MSQLMGTCQRDGCVNRVNRVRSAARYCSDQCRKAARYGRRQAAEYHKEWRRRNDTPERRADSNARSRAWRQDHAGYAREYGRAYRVANAERLARSAAERKRLARANRVASIGARVCAAKGCDRRVDLSRRTDVIYCSTECRERTTKTRWRAENTDRGALYRLRYRARRLSQTIAHVSAADVEARMTYFGWKCWMCGKPGTEPDHVKPLILGGPHMLANLRPACKSCNSRKAGRWFGVGHLDAFRLHGSI